MRIELTPEQVNQLKTETWLEVRLADGAGIYIEYNEDGTFCYEEIFNPKTPTGRRKEYSFGYEDLERLISKKPTDPSFYHDDPLCPNCSAYMIYKFECCPKCGQVLDWRERE